LFAIGAPTPENDLPGSVFEYVARISASQTNPATTRSHQDTYEPRKSRRQRSRRGQSAATDIHSFSI
jgi:hypothetical protein